MPLDAAGNYRLPPIYLASPGTTIQSLQHNSPLQDIEASMSQMLPRDGRAAATGPIRGVPGSNDAHLATNAKVREIIDDRLGTTGSGILRNLYCIGDSWTYVNTASPLNSFTVAAQSAFDAAFGASSWNVINAGIGGTAISIDVSGQATPNNMVDRIDTRVLKYSDATLVQLEGGINDIALGRNSGQIIAAIQAEAAKLSAANVPFVVCTIGPFKGAAFYNGTTRGYVDSVNTWIRSTYGAANRVIDLWNLFNDPGNDGAFLSAYRFDDFHPNHAGKVLWAQLLAANIYVAAVSDSPIAYTTPTTTMRALQRSENVAFNGVAIGTDDGIVRPLTVRSPDMLTDLEQVFLTQYNDQSSGWMVHADAGGNILFKRFASGVSLITRWLVSQLAAGFSVLTTKLWVQADGTNTRFSGTTYGGGVGAAIEVGINTATAVSISGYSQAGAAFADGTLAFKSLTYVPNGAPACFHINNAGNIYLPTIQGFASRSAAAASLGSGALFYNTTGNFVDWA